MKHLMISKQLKIYSIIFICLINAACTDPKFEPEFEMVDPKLVVYSYLSPGENFRLTLNKSRAPNELSDNSFLSSPATVTIEDIETGTSFNLNTTDNIIYKSDETATAGKSYALTIIHPDYPSVKAETTIPEYFSTQINSTFPGIFQNFTTFNVNLDIDDVSTPENFYIIEARLQEVGIGSSQKLLIFSLDEDSENNEIGDEEESFTRLYFPDRTFNGSTHTTNLLLLDNYFDNANYDTLAINTYSVSPSIYNYFKSFDKSVNDPIGLNYVQPVKVETNIENGFGFFGARILDVSKHAL